MSGHLRPGIDPVVCPSPTTSSGSSVMPPTLSCIRLSTLLDARFFHSSLPAAGAIALHACGVCHRNQAILFAARSPEPRHTLATLWRAYRPSSRVLSERRMIVRPTGSRFRAFADPRRSPAAPPGGIRLSSLPSTLSTRPP